MATRNRRRRRVGPLTLWHSVRRSRRGRSRTVSWSGSLFGTRRRGRSTTTRSGTIRP
ncbi:hypothetical protein SAMN05216207_100699 [Pseudonocardia ammonioxydans]|uniref:Uncharacterized protein n=1 Tax=Pseudonocardia ammonioxydans TaxID=260086 RepID=A0A1I4VIU3_PSUAM|nr:hypothetical protein SAMN05216207_100699 [Pseudonocardia ammonioxydans]